MNYWSTKNQTELGALIKKHGLLDAYALLISYIYKRNFVVLSDQQQWNICHGLTIIQKQL